mmetsp:Transcript_818/g.2137  ORF Transcript_818/g.2137 Transcript_818/m.2137 type:complete len:210 (-) Transcript_818:375-1004(-)
MHHPSASRARAAQACSPSRGHIPSASTSLTSPRWGSGGARATRTARVCPAATRRSTRAWRRTSRRRTRQTARSRHARARRSKFLTSCARCRASACGCLRWCAIPPTGYTLRSGSTRTTKIASVPAPRASTHTTQRWPPTLAHVCAHTGSTRARCASSRSSDGSSRCSITATSTRRGCTRRSCACGSACSATSHCSSSATRTTRHTREKR